MLDANIAGAPVVNNSGQIVGMLTEADVIWKVGPCTSTHMHSVQ
jgi:CBS domain-containing protein